MVLDASAVVELLLGSERGEDVARVMAREPDEAFTAPGLLDVEVLQALRRLVASSAVTASRAEGALELLAALPVDRHPTRHFLPRMWALRDNLTAYDAAYVTLAEALECPLLTCDAGLAGAPGHGAEVRLVG